MAGEQTLSIKLKVQDDGSIVLDQFTKKVETMGRSVQNSLSVIKLDALINLGERAFRAGEQVYQFSKNIASAVNDIERNARTLNMSTASYQKWAYAAKMADVEVSDLMTGFRFITKAVSDINKGTGDATQAFDLLGVKIKDTAGKTKNQETILIETVTALNKFADGANRDALMMEIFGRSWMQIKPLIDKGTDAIQDFMREAEKMGTVLGDVVIKKGSEAEDQFKKLEAQINATKLSLAPLALSTANFFSELVNDARGAYAQLERIGKWFSETSARSRESTEEWKRKRGYPGTDIGMSLGIKTPRDLTPEELYNLGAPGFTMEKKKEAPDLKALEKRSALIKEERADYEKAYWERQEFIWKEGDSIEDYYARRAELEAEMVRGSIENTAELRKASDDFIRDNIQSWSDYFTDQQKMREEMTLGHVNNLREIREKEYEELQKNKLQWKDIGNEIGNVLVSNMTLLMSATDNWGQKFKSIGNSILQTILQIISKVALMQALFGNPKGEYESGKGLAGIIVSGLFKGIGSALSPTPSLGGTLSLFEARGYQKGGVATSPTFGVFGESGPEAFVPLENGKIPVEMGDSGSRGPTVVNYIQITDPNTFIKLYGPIVKKLSIQSANEAQRFYKTGNL